MNLKWEQVEMKKYCLTKNPEALKKSFRVDAVRYSELIANIITMASESISENELFENKFYCNMQKKNSLTCAEIFY